MHFLEQLGQWGTDKHEVAVGGGVKFFGPIPAGAVTVPYDPLQRRSLTVPRQR